MEVIKPREEYFDEYLNACKESFDNNITEWMPFNPENFDLWKSQILTVYKNYEEGIDIPEGMPRTYTYWCILNKKFIGEIQIRPFINKEEAEKWGHVAYAVRYSEWNKGYGTKLLKLAVEKLREFNVNQIYIACHKDNQASCRVIEKNGGVFVNTISDEENLLQNVYKI